jgi:undecaprenyl-diphosphatase
MNRWVTHLGGARFTLGTGLALTLMGGDERRVGLVALLGNALSHLLVQVLKRTVARTRPCDVTGRSLAVVALPDPYSFPSGHSAAAFAVAVPVALAYPWLAPVALGLAVTVAASRVWLKVHHLSDVLAGVALGVAGSIGAVWLVRS